MLPELGSFAVILAMILSLLQAGFAFAGPNRIRRAGLVRAAATAQFAFLSIAFASLIAAFIQQDITVAYVQSHSHAALPLLYRIGATWGGHEGSLLLWCFILSGWTFLFLLFARFWNPDLHTKMLGWLGLISFGFICFLFFTSNPFLRIFPLALVSGEDLPPVLQDPGLIFHPPMLYLGYVGFVICFAFALACLQQGALSQKMAQALKPWVIIPWSFLSCGIVLGSWWAYRELGWGGWWFWDPVENASLLPWLAATALIHSLSVAEKRNCFHGWTLLLCIVTFTLSLIGTFLVRSGVLISVHTFANDPSRGLFLLMYIGILAGGAFIYYALRIAKFQKSIHFTLFSRETFLLVNSVILLTAVATILLGTLYPIVLDALDYPKISVGEPYFNTVFLPIILPLLALMGLAPHVHWQEQKWLKVFRKVRFSLFISVISTVVAPYLFDYAWVTLASVGIFIGIWIIVSTLQYAFEVQRSQPKYSLRLMSMIVAHIGIAITLLGITVNKTYYLERQVKVGLHESVELAGYRFRFQGLQQIPGENYQSTAVSFRVDRNKDYVGTIVAEQRIYQSHQQMFSRPGITANPWRDLYIALGNDLGKNHWAIRIYYEPFVRWIWAGGLILLLGGLLSVIDYLQRKRGTHEN